MVSTCGSEIRIIDGGEYNTGDGPDFSKGCITIDGLKIYGSIELHINCQDWYLHHHETDHRYNRVVLHVVLAEENAQPVRRQDGTYIPTISLYQKIPKNFASLIRELSHQDSIACSGIIKSISPDVLKNQLKIASELYFQKKVDDLLTYYDTSLPSSEAWLKMFTVAWSDGLGVPMNRENMVEVAQYAWGYSGEISTGLLTQKLFAYAGLSEHAENSEKMKKFHWDYSGSRPGNRPELRIKQLAAFICHIKSITFGSILLEDPEVFMKQFGNVRFAGKQRSQILKLTVILPAIYLLGKLFHRKSLLQFATSTWLRSSIPVPESILKPYLVAGVNRTLIENNPGIIHQSRHFCKEKHCEECFVFKNALGG